MLIDPPTTSRYLILVWISTPAAFWPLWRGFGLVIRSAKLQITFTALRISFIFLIFLGLGVSSTITFSNVGEAQQFAQSHQELEQKLISLHITRFFSEYWTCSPLIFATQEKLICASTDEGTDGGLMHGIDRYFPYRIDVMQSS